MASRGAAYKLKPKIISTNLNPQVQFITEFGSISASLFLHSVFRIDCSLLAYLV